MLAQSFIATRKPVGPADGRRNHDPIITVKKIRRRGIQIADADPLFQHRQLMFSAFFIMLSDNPQNADGQAAGPGHGIPIFRRILFFDDGQDQRITLNKNLGGIIFRQDLGDGIKKIQTEVRRRVQSFIAQPAGQLSRAPDIGLDDDMVSDRTALRHLFVRSKELIQGAVDPEISLKFLKSR